MSRALSSDTRAFTLIELLVVISIIGVLASTVLASLNDARDKAFDAKRMADLRAMQTALESYYNEYGEYPPERWCDSSVGSNGTTCADMIASRGVQAGWDSGSQFYTAIINSGVMTDLPVDPVNDATHYYTYEPNNDDSPNLGDVKWQGYYMDVYLSDGSRWGVCSGILENSRSWCH